MKKALIPLLALAALLMAVIYLLPSDEEAGGYKAKDALPETLDSGSPTPVPEPDPLPTEDSKVVSRQAESIPDKGRLKGEVVDCLGNPMPGVIVSAGGRRESPQAVTDEKGEFELVGSVDPERTFWNILPDENQWGKEFPRSRLEYPLRYLPQGTTIGIRDGKVRIEVQLNAEVSGRVQLPHGLTLERMSITFKHRSSRRSYQRSQFITSADQSFHVFNIVPGRYEVTVDSALANRFRPDPIDIEVGCGQKLSGLNLLFDKGVGTGVVRGVVRDSFGQVHAGIFFALYRSDDPGVDDPGSPSSLRDWAGSARATARSRGEDGGFEFRGLPAGTYILRRIPRQNSLWKTLRLDEQREIPIEVKEGEAVEGVQWLVKSVQKGGIKGTINLAQDEYPGALFRVHLLRTRTLPVDGFVLKESREVKVNRTGKFHKEGLPSGAWTLQVFQKGIPDPKLSREIHIPSEGTLEIDLALP